MSEDRISRFVSRSALAAGVFFLAGCGDPVPDFTGSGFVPRHPGGVTESELVELRSASFRGRYLQQQDFLFVVDDSLSMDGEIDTVRDNLNGFLAALNERRQVDYQLAVTTTDEYNVGGNLIRTDSGLRVVNSRTPGAVREFQSILDNISLGANGSGHEMGLRAAELAIEKHGERFLRDGVPLAVVILTDATDKSCRRRWSYWGQTCEEIPVSWYVDYFRNLRNSRGVPTKALLYPISARADSQCLADLDPDENWERDGDRYWTAVRELKAGAFGSICAGELEGSLNQIARQLSRRGICYDLPGRPTGNGISVVVDGRGIAADRERGYHYAADTGSVCFSGSFTPPEGAKIEVSYEDAET